MRGRRKARFIFILCAVIGFYFITTFLLGKISTPSLWKQNIYKKFTTPIRTGNGVGESHDMVIDNDDMVRLGWFIDTSQRHTKPYSAIITKADHTHRRTHRQHQVLNTYTVSKHQFSNITGNSTNDIQPIPEQFDLSIKHDNRNASRYRRFFDSVLKLDPSVKYEKQLHKFKTRSNNQGQTPKVTSKKNCFRLFRSDTIASIEENRAKSNTSYPSDGTVICDKYITISEPMGQTGNQMFQVAALFGIAHKFDVIPVIPTSFPLTRWFDLPNVSNMTLDSPLIFQPEKSSTYDKNVDTIMATTNITLYGYFQSWKYFHSIKEIIRKVFRFKETYGIPVRTFIKSIFIPGVRNICIHVRRGDMATAEAKQRGYSVANMIFINMAMEYFRKRYRSKPGRFIVISDGMMWCKENIKGNDVIYSPFFNVPMDLALLASCNDVIITSGTFGWWGAWLTRGTTVYVSGYPIEGTWLAHQTNSNDYYPRHWIEMSYSV